MPRAAAGTPRPAGSTAVYKVEAIATNSNRGKSALEFSLREARPSPIGVSLERRSDWTSGHASNCNARILKVTDKTVAKAIRLRWLE